MKRILCSLLVSLLAAALPLGSVATAAPQSKNAKVTLAYQHELPNCPGKSIKGVLVEYGPGGYSPDSRPSQIGLHVRDRARGSDRQSGQRRTR